MCSDLLKSHYKGLNFGGVPHVLWLEKEQDSQRSVCLRSYAVMGKLSYHKEGGNIGLSSKSMPYVCLFFFLTVRISGLGRKHAPSSAP